MAQKAKINVKERFSDGEIDLSMSDLVEIPVKEIAALRKTVSLDLSNNRLTSIPSTFTSLTFLIKLDLSKNELTELPEDFGSLSKLKHLDLYKNNLERLPLSFGQLNLKFLDLKDNPLIPTIAKVAGPCVDNKGCQDCARNIVKFYRKLQEEVDSEVEMRKKARQKQLEVNQQKKQEEKKKLKKEKQSKVIKEEQPTKESIANGVNNNNTSKKKSKKEQKKSKQPSKGTNSSFLTYFALIILFWIFIWFLFALEYPLAVNLVPKISEYYKLFLEKLPLDYRPYGQSFGESVVLLQGSTRNLSKHYIDVMYNSETFQVILTKINSYVDSK